MRDEAINMVVVDDNPVLLSVLSEIFRECGNNVRVASDGFVALAEIRKRVPDILVSDLSMPGMSGYELLSVVRRRFPTIRVIAMSGAFRGMDIPPGVAADAFYAKGESSVAQLIEVVRTIWREEGLSFRPATPVWISEIPIDHAAASFLLASCPECLRPFPHRLTNVEVQQRETCPHCLISFELSLVRPPVVMDVTALSISPASLQRSASMPESRRSGVAPTGMYQQ